jgi:hypothetical protein
MSATEVVLAELSEIEKIIINETRFASERAGYSVDSHSPEIQDRVAEMILSGIFSSTSTIGLARSKEAAVIESHGFLYSDPKDVEAQREKFRKFVLAYKDHPALWGIGNEVEQGMADRVRRERMWRELNYLAFMAKKLDPNHPTSIVLAGATKEKITDIRRFCPISINTYGGLRNHPKKWGWDKPYVIAEYGAYGWWEAKMTAWKAPIEQTSTEKAKEYLISYQRGIVRDRNRCLGSYVFFWDSKQEATATWFGMFLPSGERLEMVDAMTLAWSGQRPRNGSPQLKELKFAGEQAIFQSGEKVRTAVQHRLRCRVALPGTRRMLSEDGYRGRVGVDQPALEEA